MASQSRKKSSRGLGKTKGQSATPKTTKKAKPVKSSQKNVTGSLTVEGRLDIKSGSLELGAIPPGPSENPTVKGILTIEGSLGRQGGHLELGPTLDKTESPYIDFHYGLGSVQDYNARIINAANNRLDFVTESGGMVLSINNGNVGIGTNNPIAKLEVMGDLKVAGKVIAGGYGDSPENPATNASDLLRARPGLPNGVYWLKPSGAPFPFQAYCDMATDGGGWVLSPKPAGQC
jgi:hypothetical protein